MHWILMSERSDEYEASVDELPAVMADQGLAFDQGVIVPGPVGPIDIPFPLHREERMTDNLVAPTRLGLVVNEKIRQVFSALDVDNIQYVDARVIDTTTGTIYDDYRIANVIGRYDGIDREHSDVTTFPDGGIEFIDSLALAVGESWKERIFRLSEFLPILVIDDALRAALEGAAVSGLKIYRPEDFSL